MGVDKRGGVGVVTCGGVGGVTYSAACEGGVINGVAGVDGVTYGGACEGGLIYTSQISPPL